MILLFTSVVRLAADWLEAWAPLIPIVFWIAFAQKNDKRIPPVQYYFFFAFVINTLCDISWKFKDHLGPWAQSNNHLYNIHSIVRALMFLTFFYRNQVGLFKKLTLYLGIAYSLVIVVNYVFFEDIDTFASKGMSAESITLLVASLMYFFKILADDEMPSMTKDPCFWIAVGLLLFVASNFAINLVYFSLMQSQADFAVELWDVPNAFYLIFCLMCARAFYETRRL